MDEQPPQFLSKKLRPYQTIPFVLINQSSSAENLCRIVKPYLEKTNQLFVYLYDMITLPEVSHMTSLLETRHNETFALFSSTLDTIYQGFLRVYGPWTS